MSGAMGVRVVRGCWVPYKETNAMSEGRDTVVVKDGGSSTGVILGIIAIIVVLAIGWYLLMGPGRGTSSSSSNDTNINVTLPTAAPAAS
jgi:hypothetical protein